MNFSASPNQELFDESWGLDNVEVKVSSSERQRTTDQPHIQNLSLASGPAGAPVTVVGLNFGAKQGNSTVKFGATAAKITSWNDTQIQVAVPSVTPGPYEVTVITQRGTSNAMRFTVVSKAFLPPAINEVRPTSGPAGTAVTVSGENFGSGRGLSTVQFGETEANIRSWSNTKIEVIAPVRSSGTVPVTVTVGGQASEKGQTFTYIDQGTLEECQGILAQYKEDCLLLAALRSKDYFNIPNTVRGELLLQYIQKHKKAIRMWLLQIDYGGDIDRFLNKGSNALPHEQAFIKLIGDTEDFIDDLQRLVDILRIINESLALQIASPSLDIISKIFEGYKVYRFGVATIFTFNTKEILRTYFDVRIKNPPEVAWQNVVSLVGSGPGSLLRQISEKTGIPGHMLDVWFESAFLAYQVRVASPDSASIRHAEGLAIAREAIQGQ